MLTLPAYHSESELDLARRIARDLESAELHVFWTRESPDSPRGSRLARFRRKPHHRRRAHDS